MPYGLYLSAEGAYAQSRRLDVLANNMANVSTPGFKRDVALFQSRFAEAVQRGQAMPGSHALTDLGGGVKVLATETDYSSGPLASTKNTTDMAINGDAFFVVRHGGKDLLTRAGNFSLTANGRLVTQDGSPVIGVDGNPIDIDPDAGPWQLTPDGNISQAGELLPLALVRPRSPGDLAKVGDNLFAPLAPARAIPDEERNVLWQQVEQSTVKPATEMLDMIEASRAFEANVSMIRSQDEMTGNLVTQVLKQT
jgi:flagellar basal-body rod protein FlgF